MNAASLDKLSISFHLHFHCRGVYNTTRIESIVCNAARELDKGSVHKIRKPMMTLHWGRAASADFLVPWYALKSLKRGWTFQNTKGSRIALGAFGSIVDLFSPFAHLSWCWTIMLYVNLLWAKLKQYDMIPSKKSELNSLGTRQFHLWVRCVW